MKEKSHRATRECYRSVVQALRGTQTRSLDGYRLYGASDLPGRGIREARGGSLRPAGRQFRWRLGAVQGPLRALVALGCGPEHVLALWSLLLAATGCLGAARPRGALATAAVVEFGVVVGFVIRR